MTDWNAIISAALTRPYIERENDCVSMIELAHGIERPAAWSVDEPEEAIIRREVEAHGSVEAAYEAWLQLHFERVDEAPAFHFRPGMVVIVAPPPPVRPTLGLVDESYLVRWRAGSRMLSLGYGARALSVWERVED